MDGDQALASPSPHHSLDDDLKNSRNSQFSDRRTASAEAKAALLNAYKAARASDEPGRAARLAERASVAAAREAAAQAAAIAEAEECQKAEAERVARVIEDEAARKAARDLRYANRKARQR